MRTRDTLIVFTKSARICRVKTRMWPDLSHRECLYLHRQSTHSLVSKLNKSRSQKLVVYTNELNATSNFPRGTKIKKQRGRDLGFRMFDAIKQELRTSTNVVLIGSDCPEIDLNYINKAFACLHSQKDLVIGPANDGGYVLIGMRENYPPLFCNINWGTSSVLNSTLRQAARLGLRAQLLNTLTDVDDIEDLRKISKQNALPRWASPLLAG